MAKDTIFLQYLLVAVLAIVELFEVTKGVGESLDHP